MGKGSVISCNQNRLKRELDDQEKRQMPPYIESSRGKLIKCSYDERRMIDGKCRGVHIACVKFQHNFGEWVNRPGEKERWQPGA